MTQLPRNNPEHHKNKAKFFKYLLAAILHPVVSH